MNKYIKKYDIITKSFTYALTILSMLSLLLILFFVFQNGIGLLKIDLLVGDYYQKNYNASIALEEDDYCNCSIDNIPDDVYWSSKWGIALMDDIDREGAKVVTVYEIHSNSPLISATSEDGESFSVEKNSFITSIQTTGSDYAISRNGAKGMIDLLEPSDTIMSMPFSTAGGGIRGSLITTMYLIVLTLIIVLPFGILASIYLTEYAKKGKIVNLLKSLIDLLSGIPSVIYGLMGAAVFIPLVNAISGSPGNRTGNLISGALTMSVVLLPLVVRTTEEALKSVPKELKQSSLALGASNTQTMFKVIIPNSLSGILSGIILSIGRIVGESAALILAIGTVIKDDIMISDRSATLAVHIWTVMSGDNPNFELASSIALIILIIVLLMNLSIKLLVKKLDKNLV